MSASAAKSAGKAQAKAADRATDNTMAMYQQNKALLAPFVESGRAAMGQLQDLTGATEGGNPLTAPLTAPFNPTMEDLAKTPGYQFTLQQGLQATQNSFAAQGLGTSGAAMKAGANYAENLASTTYQNQFQNYLAQNQQIYNMLYNQSSMGVNAATQTGNQGAQAVSSANQYLTAGAAAQAAGTVGAANAWANGMNGLSNTLMTGLMMNKLFP